MQLTAAQADQFFAGVLTFAKIVSDRPLIEQLTEMYAAAKAESDRARAELAELADRRREMQKELSAREKAIAAEKEELAAEKEALERDRAAHAEAASKLQKDIAACRQRAEQLHNDRVEWDARHAEFQKIQKLFK